VGVPYIVSGLGEETLTFTQAKAAVVQVGDVDLLNQYLIVAPTADVLSGIDGILGYDFIKMFDLEINYQNKTLKISKAKSLAANAQTPSSDTLPISIADDKIPMIKIEIDGNEGIFEIDTGSRSSVILFPSFIQRNRLNEKYTKRFSKVDEGSIGGPLRSEVARSNILKIGKYSVPSILLNLSQQKSGATQRLPVDGLIGFGVLKRFNIQLSYENRYIKLEKNDNFDKPDIFSKLGFGFESSSGRVYTVYPNSLASRLGVEVDDVVTSIDNESISVLGVEGMQNKIAQTPGTVIKITLKKKNNTTANINLVLKDIL
jgi:PDZ domain